MKIGRTALSWETYIKIAMTERYLKDEDWIDRMIWKQKKNK